jgi:integrase
MANIRQRASAKTGETTYTVQVRLNGFPAQTATFKRKTDAKHWAQHTEAAIREGRYFPTAESKRHTVGDVIDRWLGALKPQGTAAYERQRQELTWWKDEIGEYSLSAATPALIGQSRDKLLQENIGSEAEPRYRVPATANRYLAALSKAFSEAVREWHWMHENPVLRVSKGKESSGVVRYLSDDERERLLKACQHASAPAWLYPLVLLALATGGRRGELLGLRWEHVNLERGMVTFVLTKNGETRSVPVAGKVRAALEAWAKVVSPVNAEDDRVFPGLQLDKPLAIDAYWYQALSRAGIKDFRFHDLRHSAASYLAMSGATAPEIAAVLGHKQLQMVKRYAHLGEQHTAGVVSRMVDKFLA